MTAEAVAKKPNWKLLGQLSGALGVILSLIFVAWEIRQNTEAVKSATIQAVSEQSFAATALGVENAELRKAIQAAINDQELTADQTAHLNWYYATVLRTQMNRFLQIELGVLDRDTAMLIGGQAILYQRAIFAEYWIERRDRYPEDFVEYMEELVMANNETLHGQ